MKKAQHRPLVLLVLDGWGVAQDAPGNAIARAKKPNFDKLVSTYPSMTLVSSSEAVGLSWGEMGNSEVGHMTIGAGAVHYQSLSLINQAIASGAFRKAKAFAEAAAHLKKTKGALHLLGIVSSGGVHGHVEHLYELLEWANDQKIKKVFIHCILDGRDAIYNSGLGFIKELQAKIKKTGSSARIATVMGRYFAMDRDNRWERTKEAYDAMVHGTARHTADDPVEAIEISYEQKIYDEEFIPTVIADGGAPVTTVRDGDAVLFWNFRADRARQITKAFMLPEFNKFTRERFKNLEFVTMTEYEKDLPVTVAFTPEKVKIPFAKAVSAAGLSQLHLSETEKYAHVTFFFNGGTEEPFPNEDRLMIPSPKVSSYDLEPKMSAGKVTDALVKKLNESAYDVYVVNFANADMVGHTGNLKATVSAVEYVDSCIKRIAEAVLMKEGVLAITADHGNAEEMQNLQTGKIDKEHSTNPVPFIVVGKEFEGKNAGLPDSMGPDLSLVQPVGTLCDVAPTLLSIVGIKKPKEMTGTALL